MTSYCRKNNWDELLENLVNKQINLELYASHIYLALSAFFMSDSVEYPGMSKFFMDSSNEEREHANKFIEYQNTRGGLVKLDTIPKPELNFSNDRTLLIEVMKYTLDLEQSVYDSIQNMSKLSHSDSAFSDFLDEFLKEQLESQYQLGRYIKQLEHIGQDGHGIWSFDQMFLK